MAGVTGIEPVKWRIQSPLPYRLATPQLQNLFDLDNAGDFFLKDDFN